MPQEQHRCASCDKEAKLFCSDCKEAPLNGFNVTTSNGSTYHGSAYNGFTWYCSSTCQATDRPKHKKKCQILKERKMVYRAGDILQEMFYQYRENTFDKVIAKIKREEGKTTFVEGQYPIVKTSYDGLCLFPNDKVQDKDEKKRLLVYLACTDAVGLMQEVTKLLLQDVTSSIHELKLDPKNPKHKMVGIFNDGITDEAEKWHEISILTLKLSRDRYALDLTGAQFGYYGPIVPYIPYLHERIQTIAPPGEKENGAMKKTLLTMPKTLALGFGLQYALNNLNLKVSEALIGATNAWFVSKEIKVKDCLGLTDEKKFEAYKTELLAAVSGSTQAWMNAIKNDLAKCETKEGAIVMPNPSRCWTPDHV